MKKAIMILLAAALMLSAFALAANTITGPVITSGEGTQTIAADVEGNVSACEQSKLTVNGNITAKDSDGVDAADAMGTDDKTRAELTVNGNVHHEGDSSDGVWGYQADATINGNVTTIGADTCGIEAEDNAFIMVNGNIALEGQWGACARADKGSASVKGNITGTGESVAGVEVADDAEINVIGNVDLSGESMAGICAYGSNSTITVDGDVSLTGNYLAGMDVEDSEFTVRVSGDLIVNGDDSCGIGIWIDEIKDPEVRPLIAVNGTLRVQGEDCCVFDINSIENDLKGVQLYLGGIEMGEGVTLTCDDEAFREAVLSTINFMITTGEGVTVQRMTDNGPVKPDWNEDLEAYSAKCGDTLILTLADGYSWDGEYPQMTDNGDGTYTVVIAEDGNLKFNTKK